MNIQLFKKAVHRIFQICTGKKGVYCKQGKGNRIGSNVFLHEMSQIGNYNYIGSGTMFLNAKIGNYCSIANGVKIGQMQHDLNCVSTSTHIFGSKRGITNFNGYLEPATIGNDVWIAANCVIMQGVTIGNGAVIGAGAIVTKDVNSYEIVGGVPAKHIRYRFDEDTIKMLEDSQWWNLPPKEAVKKCKELQGKVNK